MPILTIDSGPITFDDLTTYNVTEGSGTLLSGQQYISKVPDSGPGYVGVVYLHGAFSTETEMTDGSWIDAITTLIASRGFPVIGGRIGGSLWGNDASKVLVGECVDYLTSDLGADSYGKVVIIGTSMGGMNALNWIAENLSSTACFVGLAPLSDAQAVYDMSSLFSDSIDDAYGGPGGWISAQPTHDPTPMSQNGAFSGVNYKAWYGDADTIVTPETVEFLASEIGSTAALKLVSGDHTTIADTVNAHQILSYIVSHYPPALAQRSVINS